MTERRFISSCPLCDSRRLYYIFSRRDYRLVRCARCTLLLINPQPSDVELDAIYSTDNLREEDTLDGRPRTAEEKGTTARSQLRQLARYRGEEGGRLLEIGCGQGEFLLEAQSAGYNVTGLEISPSAAALANKRLGENRVSCGVLETASLDEGSFDVCILSDVIEHTRDPRFFLKMVRRALKPGGVLYVAVPSLDSWSARLPRQSSMEFRPERLTYFDGKTMQNLLYRCGFEELIVEPEYKAHSLNSAAASGMSVFARAAIQREARTLSVIVPAFNEGATLEPLMQSLLAKRLRDLDIEVLLVESNSTDNTREIALRYQNHPRVKVILEDRPRGKGHAVRTGFEHATGDFILIQDADLEYDLEDYDALLEPLSEGRETFVLGSRHGGSAWKMRSFVDQRWLSLGLNAGHWFFTALVNILFGQRLKDPFTMFKVFRRDCLFGLRFECNRFDFDYELLIKLVRKGYRPIEIPVNYRSRSFKEGKKVSVWRDPLLWILALARLRLSPIDPMREIERRRTEAHAATAPSPELVANEEKR